MLELGATMTSNYANDKKKLIQELHICQNIYTLCIVIIQKIYPYFTSYKSKILSYNLT